MKKLLYAAAFLLIAAIVVSIEKYLEPATVTSTDIETGEVTILNKDSLDVRHKESWNNYGKPPAR